MVLIEKIHPGNGNAKVMGISYRIKMTFVRNAINTYQ